MSTDSQANWPACLNLLVPGGGIVLLGWVWTGLVVGLLFTICANYALWATLLVPDEFPSWAQGLGIGLAGGTYLGAQLRLAQAVRSQQQQRQATLRRQALLAARDGLRRGDFTVALAALEPLRELASRDLLVAYRLAQVYTALQDVDAARAAWRQVRALDRHGVYRHEMRVGDEAVVRSCPGSGSPSSRVSGES